MSDPRTTFAEMSETEFMQWRHSPVTAAFLRFLGDQESVYRQAAMDLWEAGRLAPQSEELRGRVLALSEVRDLNLQAIQTFYADQEENRETKTD